LGTNFLRLPSGGFMGLKPKQQPHTVPRLPPDDYRLGHTRMGVKANTEPSVPPRCQPLSLHSVKAPYIRAFR